MGLKTILSVTGEVTTTDANWTTVSSCAIPSNCGLLIDKIFVQGKSANAPLGEVANATAIHRGKKVSGVLTLEDSILFILTFDTGSSLNLRLCSMRISVSGSNLLLQVKGIALRNIDWYGGFTVILN